MSMIETSIQFPSILARDEAEEIIKIIFGAVFVAIWIIGALLSSTKNKRKQAPGRKEKSWEEILQDLAGGKPEQAPQPPAQPEPPPLPRQMPAPGQTPPPLPKPARSGPHRKKVRPKPARREVLATAPPMASAEPVVTQTMMPASVPAGDIIATEIGQAGEAEVRRRGSARAAALAQLLRPQNLRSQFILTEILQPPMALREEPR